MQTTGNNNNGDGTRTSRDSSNRVDDTEDWDIDKFFLPGGILDPDTTSNNDDGGNGGQDDGNNHRQQHGLLDPIQEETLLTQMVQPSGVGVGSLLPTTTALLSASDNPWADDNETNENEVVVGSSIVLGGGSSSSRSSSRIPSNNPTTTAVATAATVTTTTSASLTLSSLCEDESPSLLLKGGNTIHEDGTTNDAASSSTDYSSSLFSTNAASAIHPPDAQPRHHESGLLLSSSPPLLFADRQQQQQQRDNNNGNGSTIPTIMNNNKSPIAPPGTRIPPPPGIIPLIPPPGFEAAASTTSLAAAPTDPASTREEEKEEVRIERNDTQDSWYSTHSADDGSSGEGGEESDSIAAPVGGQPQHDAPQPSVLPSTVSLSPAKLDSANDDAAAAFPQQSLLQATPTRVPESWTTIETKESSDDRKGKNNDKIRSGSSSPYEHHRKKKVDDAAAVDDNGSGRSEESARRRKKLRDRDNNLSPAVATTSVSAQEDDSSHLPKSVKEAAKPRLKSKQQISLKKHKRNRHDDSLQNASKPEASNGERNKVEGPGMAYAHETQNNDVPASSRLQSPSARNDDSIKRRFVSTLSNFALFLFHIATTPFTHCFRFLSALYKLITEPAAAAASFVGKFGLFCLIAVHRATMIALEELHLVHDVRDMLHDLFQPYNIIGPRLSFDNNSQLTSWCYLTLYFTPAASDWIMQNADFPQYSPHIISNLTLYHLTYRIRQYVRRRTKDLPSPSRRGSARSNNSGGGSSGNGSGANLSNYLHSHNNNVFAEADRRRLETDLNQKILRALLWAIPLNFICEGFSETDASFMRMDSFARLITAFGLSLVPGSFFLSPVAWVSGSVQILLSLYILQEGFVSDLVLIFVGFTSVGLIRSLQRG